MRASQFSEYLITQVKNGSLYVWSGQGELLERMSLATLKGMETDSDNFCTVLQTYESRIMAKKNMSKARVYDCSGLGVHWLLENDIIKKDMTADALFKLCKPITFDKVAEGDFVVKNKTATGAWGHIGYVIKKDGELKVVEAKGRAYGVVYSSLSGWKAIGRPDWWLPEPYTFNRKLTKGMTGDDVKVAQERLNYLGYYLTVDGEYGSKTKAATLQYQKDNRLTSLSGNFNKETALSMGFSYLVK